MRIIELYAGDWKTARDFIAALKRALNAPKECGSNVDAINELMVWGLGMGELPGPYIVRIAGVAKAPKEVRDHIVLTANYVQKARAEMKVRDGKDVDVNIKY